MPVLSATPTGTRAIAATRATTAVKVDKDGTTTVFATINQGILTAEEGAPTMDTAIVTKGMMTLVVPIKAQAIVGMTIALVSTIIVALTTVAMIALAVTTRRMDAMILTTYVKGAVALKRGVALGLVLLIINAAGGLTATIRVEAAFC